METFYKRSGALNLDSGDGRGVKRSKARWESSAVAWHLPEPIALDMSTPSHVMCSTVYIYILSEFFDMLQPKVQPPVSDCFYVLVPSVTAGNIQHIYIDSLGTPRTYRFGSTSSRASGATCVHNHLPFEFMTLFQAVYIYI